MIRTFWSIRQLGFALVLLTLELNVFACHCLYAFPNHHHQTSPVERAQHTSTHDHTSSGCIHAFAVQPPCELQSGSSETARLFYIGLEVALSQNANVDPLFDRSSYLPPLLPVAAIKHPAVPDIPPERLLDVKV